MICPSQEASWTGIVDTTDSLCRNTQTKTKAETQRSSWLSTIRLSTLGSRSTRWPTPRKKHFFTLHGFRLHAESKGPRKEKQDGDPIKQQWWKYVLRSILVLLYSDACNSPLNLQLSQSVFLQPSVRSYVSDWHFVTSQYVNLISEPHVISACCTRL